MLKLIVLVKRGYRFMLSLSGFNYANVLSVSVISFLVGASSYGQYKHHYRPGLIAKKSTKTNSPGKKSKKKDFDLPSWKEIKSVKKLSRKQNYYLNKKCGHYNYKIHTLIMEKQGLMIQYDIPFKNETFNRGSMVLAHAGGHLGKYGSKKEAQARIKEINREIRSYKMKLWNTAKTVLNKTQIEEARNAAKSRKQRRKAKSNKKNRSKQPHLDN